MFSLFLSFPHPRIFPLHPSPSRLRLITHQNLLFSLPDDSFFILVTLFSTFFGFVIEGILENYALLCYHRLHRTLCCINCIYSYFVMLQKGRKEENNVMGKLFELFHINNWFVL